MAVSSRGPCNRAPAKRRAQFPTEPSALQVFAGNRNIALAASIYEHIGLTSAGSEFQAIGRASRDDDVIEVARRTATARSQNIVCKVAAAGMNEDHLVCGASALRSTALALRLLGATARPAYDVIVAKEHEAARDGVARALESFGFLRAMMTQGRLIVEIGRDGPRRLQAHHAGRRAQVISNAVYAREKPASPMTSS